MGETFLITGVAGFVGSSIARKLLSDGCRVIGVDNFATGRADLVEQLKGLDFHKLDICDTEKLSTLVAQADFVLHQAAIPSVARSVQDPLSSHRANIEGTLSVLEAVRKSERCRRVVYAGSSSAYGDTPTLPKVESMATAPKSPYAVQKLCGENYMRAYAGVFGLETLTLRYFNVFGPHQDEKSSYAAAIPNFIKHGVLGTVASVHGDGEQTRDFTYIDNVVHANLLACRAPKVSGETVNIACGDRISINRILDEVGHILGCELMREYTQSRRGDVRDSMADISAAKTLIAYQPQVSFEDGLKKTVAWYRERLS